jgi:hypothetical protein
VLWEVLHLHLVFPFCESVPSSFRWKLDPLAKPGCFHPEILHLRTSVWCFPNKVTCRSSGQIYSTPVWDFFCVLISFSYILNYGSFLKIISFRPLSCCFQQQLFTIEVCWFVRLIICFCVFSNFFSLYLKFYCFVCLFLVGLGFELRASYLQNRCCAAWPTPPVHYFRNGVSGTICLHWPPTWISASQEARIKGQEGMNLQY